MNSRFPLLICLFAQATWACLASEPGSVPKPAVAIREGAFVDNRTGEPFSPRGFNYIRLFPGRSHDTFDPEHYDAEAVDKVLQRWQEDGFNVVRVFLNSHARLPGSIAATGQDGLSTAYVANVADFLDRAREHRIAVMLCTESFPLAAPYSDGLRKQAMLDPTNAQYLATGPIEAKARFLRDLIAQLHAASPTCLAAIFSYDLQNEFCFHCREPFTLTSGELTAANGKTYTLPEERQELADDGAVYFIDRMVDAIAEAHPDALVSASVFTYAAVDRTGPGDFRVKQAGWQNRVPFRPVAILRSKADFLDLHFYAADAEAWQRDLDSIEFDQVRRLAAERGKPMIVGEFGAFKRPFPSVESAAAWMGALAGRFSQKGFVGWIYWTYDTHEQSEQLWHACDGGSAIYRELKKTFAP